jgi:hypothetical protein
VYILGINGGVRSGNQDASACLLKDGKLIAAAEEWFDDDRRAIMEVGTVDKFWFNIMIISIFGNYYFKQFPFVT